MLQFVLQVFIGPERDNTNFGALPELIGDGAPFFSVAYAAPTTGARVRYDGAADTGGAVSGEAVVLDILPFDRFNNLQDYIDAPMDQFTVNVTVNDLYVMQASLTLKTDSGTLPPTKFFRARFVPVEVGRYVVDVYLRNAGTGMEFEAVAGSKVLQVAAGSPVASQSSLSGLAVRAAAAGAVSSVRLQLRDASSNDVGAGGEPLRRRVLLEHLAPSTSSSAVRRLLAHDTNLSSPLPASTFPMVTAHLVPRILVDRVSATSVALAAEGMNYTTIVNVTAEYDDLERVYYLQYNATRTGKYELQVLVYGELITVLDYTSTTISAGTVYPPLCSAEGNGVGDGGRLSGGQPTEFIIRTVDVYGNRRSQGGVLFDALLQSATYRAVGELNRLNSTGWDADGRYFVRPSVPADNRDGTYTVTYTPRFTAFYVVQIVQAGQPLQGSPYLVDVTPAETDGTKCVVACLADFYCGLGTVRAGYRASIFIQARDADGNNKTDTLDNFFYSAVGQSGYSISAKARPMGSAYPGVYEVNFNSQSATTLALYVTFGDVDVLTTSIKVVAGNLDSATSTLGGTGFPVSTAGVPSELVVTARDTYGNRLTEGGSQVRMVLYATTTQVAEFEIGVIDNDDGTYTGLLQRSSSANYTVLASIDGLELQQKMLFVQAGTLVLQHTLVGGAGRHVNPGPYTAGELSNVTFLFRDNFFNSRLQGRDLALRDVSLTVYPLSERPGLDLEAVAANVSFVAGDDALDRGKYVLAFELSRAGVMRIELSLGGVRLFDPATGKPYQAVVLPARAFAANCVVFGAARDASLMDERTGFKLETFDRFGNPLAQDTASFRMVYTLAAGNTDTILSNGVRLMPQGVTYVGANVYEVHFVPPVFARVYSLSVAAYLVDQVGILQPVPGGEFVMSVYSEAGAASALASLVLDPLGAELALDAANSLGRAGSTTTFYVQARDANRVQTGVGSAGSPLERSWLTVDVAPQAQSVSVASTAVAGQFEVSLYVTRAGVYNVRLFGGGRLLGGNWPVGTIVVGEVLVRVVPAPSSALTALVTDLNPRAISGIASSFSVRSLDAYRNFQKYRPSVGADPYVGVLTQLNVANPISTTGVLTDNQDGTYLISYVLTRAGLYSLAVTLDMFALSGIPVNFTVNVVPGTVFPPACVIQPNTTELVSSVAGEAVNFTIVARDQYNNLNSADSVSFTLVAQGPLGAQNAYTTVRSNNDGTYTAQYTPLQMGVYRLSVIRTDGGMLIEPPWNSQVAPNVVDYTRTVVDGTGLSGGIAGSTLEITMALTDVHGNPVANQSNMMSIEILNANMTAIIQRPQAVDAGNGLIDSSFTLNDVGSYFLRIKVLSDEIDGSPFAIVMSPVHPPQMLSAQMTSSLTAIMITFDQPTNRGGLQGTASCARFLVNATLDLLGHEPVCTWITDRDFTMFLGSEPSVLEASLIMLKTGVVFNKRENSHGASGVLSLMMPSVLPNPVAILSAPSMVGLCDELLLDASASSGGGGRQLDFR